MLNTTGENPEIYIGGKWISWGSGRVPVGVDEDDSDFNEAEKIGGSKQLQSHAHNFSTVSGTQSANHTHTIPAHAHGLNNHTHDFYASTGVKDLTGDFQTVAYSRHTGTGIVSGAKGAINASLPSGSSYGGMKYTVNASHEHVVSGTTNGASGSTANSSESTTGLNSAEHTHSVSGTTEASGIGNSQNLQPYITCFMWKRIA